MTTPSNSDLAAHNNTLETFAPGLRWSVRQIFRASFSIWLLGFYFLPNTIFGRISPISLFAEVFPRYPFWIEASRIGFLCILSILILKKVNRSSSKKHMPLWLLMITLFVIMYAAMVSLAHYSESERAAASVLIAMNTGVFAIVFLHQSQEISFFVGTTTFIQALYTLYYQRLGFQMMISGEMLRAGGTFDQPNDLCLVMLVALPFTLLGAVRVQNIKVQFAYLCAAGLQVSCIFLTGNRGGIIALGIAISMFCYIITRSKRLTIMILCCTVILAGMVFARRSSGPVNGLAVHHSNSSRLLLWKEGWKTFLQSPLTGVGIGNFSAHIPEERGKEIIIHEQKDPHNLLLHWLAEMGLAGGLFLVLLISTAVDIVRRTADHPLAAAVAAAWIGIIVVGFTDTPFGPPSRHVGNCVVGLVIGITAITPYLVEHEKLEREKIVS